MSTEASRNDAYDVEVLVDPSPQVVRRCLVAPGMGVLYRYHPDAAQRLCEGLPRFLQGREGRLVLARDGAEVIVGYAVIAKPDPQERWGKAGVPELWELAIIEVARQWRQRGIGRKLLRACFADGAFDDRIVLATAYAWHWDLEGAGLSKTEYRALLSRLFDFEGFKPFETDEPNVLEDPANRFFVRIGPRVDPEAYAKFVALLDAGSRKRAEAALEINNAVIANLDRETLFDAIAQALHRVLPFDRAALYLYDPLQDALKMYGLAGSQPLREIVPVGTEIPRQGSRAGWVFDQRRPLVGGDLNKETPWPRDHTVMSRLIEAGIRSYLLTPLITKRGAIGILGVTSRAADLYSLDDVELLTDVTKQIALAVDNMLVYEELAQLKARLEQEKIYLQEEIKTQHNFEEIIGESPPIRKVLKAVEMVAPTDATVLLIGETGTGKELLARAVHNLSPRKDRALVKVNCAALPPGLIESELFGHEKGAFTGALARKIGRFELADGGTIFLDEIGDLPMDLQAKLLRVLQEGEFERVGGTSTLKVDVRVIAATNRDLEKAFQENAFRPDLYYRLSVFPVSIPPLRERKQDIPPLVRYFVMKYGGKLGKKIEKIPQKTMEALLNYPWPGNVRELENVIERAVIISKGSQLDLGEWLPKPGVTRTGERMLTMEELEREHIIRALELTGWRVSGERGAAKLLGLKPTTLDARMKKLGVTKKGVNTSNIS